MRRGGSGPGPSPVPLPVATWRPPTDGPWWPALALTAAALLLRLFTAPTTIDSLDALLFVRGLARYSVLEARPHWPGYPVYLAAGRLLELVRGEAEASLRLVSILASSLSVWPLMALVRDWKLSTGSTSQDAGRAAVMAGLLWMLAPLSCLVGTEIGSDPLGLLVALTVLSLCSRSVAASPPRPRPLIAAGALGGVLLGVRLPYGSLLLPLAYALGRQAVSSREGRQSRRVVVWWALATALPVIGWLGWQLSMDGAMFFDMAHARLAAHYGNWTERVVAHGHWLSRPARLLRVLAVDGLGGWWPGLSPTRGLVTLGWVVLIVSGARRLAAVAVGRRMLALWALPYLATILLFNDVALARYSLPLVAGLSLLGGLGIPRSRRLALGATAAMASALAAIALPLAWEHRNTSLPAVQWVRYLEAHARPERTALVITDQVPLVSLIVEEYAPDYPHALVSLSEMPAVVAAREAEGRRVYSTSPDPAAPHEWTPVACFTRNPLLQSRGPWEVWLYEHGGQPAPRRPVCRVHS